MGNRVKAIAKLGTKVVSVGSIDFLIGGVLASVMPAGVGLPVAAARFFASVILAGYIGDKMENYIDETIDQTFDIIDESKNLVKETINNVNMAKEELGG